MEISGRVGSTTVGTGTRNEMFAQGRHAEQLVGDLMPRYFYANWNGLVYTATTATAGATVAAGGSVTNPLLALYNPASSDRILVAVKASFAHVSGTAGVGHVGYWITAAGTAAGAGTGNVTPLCANSTGATDSIAKGYAAVTNALATAGTFYRPMLNVLSATTVPVMLTDELAGEIILRPGAALSINPGATGATWVCLASITYIEVPLLPG